MRPVRTVYLSGPYFTGDSGADLRAEAAALCAAAGVESLSPGPEEFGELEVSEAMAREIYARRVSHLRRADALICDLTPFRGPGCDPSTAFETGFAAGLGRPVFAFMNLRNEVEAEVIARVEAYEGANVGEDGVWRDGQGVEIEDFGLPEGLMLWAEARRLFVIVTEEPDHDLTGLQLCLEAIRLYAE